MGKTPIFGICLGHQMLGYALGGKTFKLKFGHRGGNQPVKDLATGKVTITSQNHGFAVDPDSLPPEMEVTHINLNDQTVEGLRHRALPVFCVQYHPEAAPGPNDASYFFQQFAKLIEESPLTLPSSPSHAQAPRYPPGRQRSDPRTDRRPHHARPRRG